MRLQHGTVADLGLKIGLLPSSVKSSHRCQLYHPSRHREALRDLGIVPTSYQSSEHLLIERARQLPRAAQLISRRLCASHNVL